jgi:hypothetical protein
MSEKRRFRVYFSCGHSGGSSETIDLEFSADATEEEIEDACEDACSTLIANNTDSGWFEV